MSDQFGDVLNRRNNGSMKWETAYIQKRFQIEVNEQTELYPLFIADMDYKESFAVKQQLQQYIDAMDFGYFHVQDHFYQSIIEWYQDIHHITLQKEWIIPSIGTITTLHLLCDMLARQKDIVFMTPVYGPFYHCAKIGQPFMLPLINRHQRYEIDFFHLEHLFQIHDVRVLLFCNPHNPGGRMWTYEELHRLVKLCQKYQVIILSDEIHGDLQLTEQRFVSLIEFSQEYSQIMVSTSPNKTFNISALTTSFVLCSDSLLKKQFEDYLDRLHLGVNRMGIDMIEMVYRYGKDWFMQLKTAIRQNVSLVAEKLKDTDMSVMMPDCGYMIWVYLPQVSDIDAFILALAKDTHVLLESGSRFVEHYQGWLRINVATDQDLLKEAMERFVRFYHDYTQMPQR